MKIPMRTVFLNTDGQVMTKDNKPYDAAAKNGVTMKDVCVIATTTEFQEDQNPQNVVQEKLRRYQIYQKLAMLPDDAEYAVLTPEDAAYLKPRVARCFAVLIAGPAMEILDGNAVTH